jgi:hypothetical protein
MADLVQITVDYDQYEITMDPRHAYVPLEIGSREAKIRRHEGPLRIILTEEAFRSLEQAFEDLRAQRGGDAGGERSPP